MLSDAIGKTMNQAQKQKAQKVLDEAVAAGKQSYNKGRWSGQPDPFAIDHQLNKVRAALEEAQ